MQKFIGVATILLMVKGADVFTTWLYTPDFSMTIHPLRAVLPFWGFFVYQAVALTLLWVGMDFHFTKPLPPIPHAESQGEFRSMALFVAPGRVGVV